MRSTGVELIAVILFSVQGPIAYYVLFISVQGDHNCQECFAPFHKSSLLYYYWKLYFVGVSHVCTQTHVRLKNIYYLASGVSLPSHVNIYIFICDGRCTYHNIIRASNFACALSRSPTMLCIQLVYPYLCCMLYYRGDRIST